MTQLLQKSLNTGAVWVGQQIGPERFYEYVKRFGFGEPTDVGLGGEAAGNVRTSDDPEWYPVDLATNSFGQGISVTPLQMITAVAAIANGGELMRPLHRRRTSSGRTATRSLSRWSCDASYRNRRRARLRGMMNDVVEGNALARSACPGLSRSGKDRNQLHIGAGRLRAGQDNHLLRRLRAGERSSDDRPGEDRRASGRAAWGHCGGPRLRRTGARRSSLTWASRPMRRPWCNRAADWPWWR